MHELDQKPKKALLIGIGLPGMKDDEIGSSLDELARLVTTLGYSPVGRLWQRRSSTKSAHVLGEGKLQQAARWTGGSGEVSAAVERKLSKAALKFEKNIAKENEPEPEEEEESGEVTDRAEVAIVDSDLSPSQLRNLESALGCAVMDRTAVIIEIFSRHARTKAARLQIEIARLTYLAPRLRETGGGGDRQGGGIGAKGAGETALELDKRRIRDRIKELKTELSAIDKEQEVRRSRRHAERTVALVGYTNAGKSSLMRALTGSEVLVADKLFATLDTTVRPLHPESIPKILVSDTVGFIKKLPHDLVASFKSTLDEAHDASFLLYVVDASDPAFPSQLKVTQDVLAEVGVSETPGFLILNKVDRIDESARESLAKDYPEGILISTRNPSDIKNLHEKIVNFFETGMDDVEIFLPYSKQKAIGEIRSRFRVISERHDENGAIYVLRGHSNEIDDLKRRFSL